MVKSQLLLENAEFKTIASELAKEKARTVSSYFPDKYILGADQVLVLNNEIINKAQNLEEAQEILERMRGKKHELITASTIFREEKILWSDTVCSNLVVRPFSNQFLENYIKNTGPNILNSVGCYALEDKGLQLFDQVCGDYFSILGLPMLSLLKYLRSVGILER